MPPPSHAFVYPKDLRLMSSKELLEQFASTRSGRLVLTRLMRALVVQAWRQIQRGEEEPVQGNLRTFWYRFVKPVLSTLGPRHLGKSDPYDAMLSAFGWVISKQGWALYRDFDFTDENWAHRFLGSTRPEQLVFSEKRGWIRFLRRCHEDLGTSALALGGAPSALTSEYTAHALLERLAPGVAVSLLGIVDWDPSGALIASSFRRQLETSGLPVKSLELLVRPEYLTPRQLELAPVTLPRGQPTKTARWLESSGGLHGQPLGFESEAMPWHTLFELLEAHLASS